MSVARQEKGYETLVASVLSSCSLKIASEASPIEVRVKRPGGCQSEVAAGILLLTSTTTSSTTTTTNTTTTHFRSTHCHIVATLLCLGR